MKNYNKSSTSKLVSQFDKELMSLLAQDLKAYKTKTQFVNKQAQPAALQAAA
ncbi:hypothetical protein KHS38_06950 [Mucilaginibacter sp. Bleaf8]|uniref:hypothetical protein n=1 Tax=Mucilaginibacter sp. Bleaf8 TaxID=2834430 RepID=UPI001BD0D5B0|nr:hypothetical protein [Mucilaginibacter sp. Bleaf8]MBS7564139.1 hypothetical protein [Mucilaginibacter sp. Bleaf8]